ncbi:uncharacterized protein LOC118480911 [Helianthus annuus]|uniref:uncharacterized protein LOC118480911 n=1 Tax=Helianthus annuus TaxID=4232 RepID=UPI00165336F3|nr:uncharacterized protein LOC118480911 [Helianthus annuus]
MAFVKASTCPIVGNNQSGSSFWKKTTDRFNTIMEHGPARDVESVSGKWRKMIKVVNAFNQIYNQIYLSPPSGSNDDDILNLATAKWDSQNPTLFPHFRAWNVVRKEQKWKPVPNEVATAKHTKTSESGSYSAGGSTARCQIDINDDPEDDEDVLPVHESERPPGRDKAKKEAAGKRKVAGSSGVAARVEVGARRHRDVESLKVEVDQLRATELIHQSYGEGHFDETDVPTLCEIYRSPRVPLEDASEMLSEIAKKYARKCSNVCDQHSDLIGDYTEEEEEGKKEVEPAANDPVHPTEEDGKNEIEVAAQATAIIDALVLEVTKEHGQGSDSTESDDTEEDK